MNAIKNFSLLFALFLSVSFVGIIMPAYSDSNTTGNPTEKVDSTFPSHLSSSMSAANNKMEKTELIASVFGNQSLKVYTLPFEDAYPSGPFERLGKNQFLFIDKCGNTYFTVLENELKLLKPAGSLSKYQPGDTDSMDESSSKKVVYCKELSGVKDSLLIKNSLFVAYTTWDSQQNGARLAVSEFSVDVENAEVTFKREIYLSRPAVKEPFLGHQVGGKLAMGENDNVLFLSIGDFSKPERVQDKTTSLGKVIRINLQNLSAEVYASGLRSPSGGIYYDKVSDELWVTDHGPRGGDEINLIKKGKNYGWPLVSYGTIYERDGLGNYYGNKFNNHDGFEKPVMTFVPSIGIGPIAKYADTGKNDYWDNDYFVAGMASTTLYRVKKEGHNLVYAEPVLSGYRIRAMKIDADGTFFLKTDQNQFLISD